MVSDGSPALNAARRAAELAALAAGEVVDVLVVGVSERVGGSRSSKRADGENDARNRRH